MIEPIFSTTLERLYNRLPEFYRILDGKTYSYEDAITSIDYPFKTWLSGIVDVCGDIDTTIERLKFVPIENRREYISARTQFTTYERPIGLENIVRGFLPINKTSDLFDARTANIEWLEWIGTILGIPVTNLDTEEITRDKLINAYTGYTAGSKDAMVNAVKLVLTGDKYAKIYDHTEVSGTNLVATTNEWHVTIVTKAIETPGAFDVSAYLISKGAKPAGVKLYYLVYSIFWTTLETNYPTWTAIDAVANWDILEATN